MGAMVPFSLCSCPSRVCSVSAEDVGLSFSEGFRKLGVFQWRGTDHG
jgi:hypothetical protein